jgi:hypothetical protein
MSQLQHLLRGLGCLAVLALGIALIPGLNQLGGWLAQALGLPRGGDGRLAWDLAWVAISCAAALWTIARWAPAAKRALSLVVWALLAGALAWGDEQLGAHFPTWFRAGLWLLLAALLGAALWLTRKSPPSRAA